MASVLKVRTLGQRFLETLPGVALAFGYGSGVFVQPHLYRSGNAEQPQIDFILAVEDPLQWHRENLTLNRGHYAGTSFLGAKWIDFVASRIGVGVHFNTLVPFEDQMVKYGIASVASLKQDLTSWQYLYLSGRLHKPVLWIKSCEFLMPSLLFNRHAALAAALLLSPPLFRKRDLFRRICGLSYSGDIRMSIAEDDSKVDRIVDGSFQQFDALYSASIAGEMGDLVEAEDAEQGQLRMPPTKRHHLLSFLPQAIRDTFPARAEREPYDRHLLAVLSQRVASSSRLRKHFGVSSPTRQRMETRRHSMRLGSSSPITAASQFVGFTRRRSFRFSLPSPLRRERLPRRVCRSCYCLSSSLKDDIRVLKRELTDAVNEEDYFRAATLRDEILVLEDKDPVLSMKKQLAHAVELEDYKFAAELRDELRRITQSQIDAGIRSGDAVACNSDLLTRGIRVRVRSFYVEHLSAPAQEKYVFAYQVEITNEGEETVQLKNRSWKIVDGDGKTETVNGSGVIGQQPILGPGCYFQYMSICPLETPVGTMEGYYEMVVLNRHSQQTFFANIGKFGLNVNMHRQFKD